MNQMLLQLLKENKGIVLSGVGAFIRGEDPITWIKRLAQTHPALREYNLDDLDGTAAQLCQEKNINQAELSNEITELANSYRQSII